MTVSAPFAFARVSRFVHLPDMGEVSHDVPFANGFCGEIDIELSAKTDLLVGGARRKPEKAKEGEVWPFQLPSGNWAIPPTALQGMIRAVMEIATFARLGPLVENRRFAYRELSGATAKKIYTSQMTSGVGTWEKPFRSKVQSGWLRRTPKGPEIVRCARARTPIIKKDATLSLKNDAGTRYGEFFGKDANKITALDLPGLDTKIDLPSTHQVHRMSNDKYVEEVRCGFGSKIPATLIITGKPNDGIGRGQKKREFFFHTPDRPTARTSPATHSVTAAVWEDFRLVHETGKGGANPNWDFWRRFYLAGELVPIFFRDDSEEATALGTASMFKVALPLFTHDMLRHSHADHLSDEPDLPTLIFGSVEAKGVQKFSLKRRVAFETAVAKTAVDPRKLGTTVLLGPKPNCAANYVRHDADPGADRPYATYAHQTTFGPAWATPELAGVKIWPVTTEAITGVPDPPPLKRPTDSKKTWNSLNPLPAGTEFRPIPVHVHNLRPFEIGALLWALTFGNPDRSDRFHRLGMGKPYGLGALRIRVGALRLRPNRRGDPVPTVKAFITIFKDHMQAHCPDSVTWENTPQVRALLEAAKSSSRRDRAYMALGDSKLKETNTYIGEKAAGRVLPAFTTGDEPALGDVGRSPAATPADSLPHDIR